MYVSISKALVCRLQHRQSSGSSTTFIAVCHGSRVLVLLFCCAFAFFFFASFCKLEFQIFFNLVFLVFSFSFPPSLSISHYCLHDIPIESSEQNAKKNWKRSEKRRKDGATLHRRMRCEVEVYLNWNSLERRSENKPLLICKIYELRARLFTR